MNFHKASCQGSLKPNNMALGKVEVFQMVSNKFNKSMQTVSNMCPTSYGQDVHSHWTTCMDCDDERTHSIGDPLYFGTRIWGYSYIREPPIFRYPYMGVLLYTRTPIQGHPCIQGAICKEHPLYRSPASLQQVANKSTKADDKPFNNSPKDVRVSDKYISYPVYYRGTLTQAY